jgi:hypothetical protein
VDTFVLQSVAMAERGGTGLTGVDVGVGPRTTGDAGGTVVVGATGEVVVAVVVDGTVVVVVVVDGTIVVVVEVDGTVVVVGSVVAGGAVVGVTVVPPGVVTVVDDVVVVEPFRFAGVGPDVVRSPTPPAVVSATTVARFGPTGVTTADVPTANDPVTEPIVTSATAAAAVAAARMPCRSRTARRTRDCHFMPNAPPTPRGWAGISPCWIQHI